MIFATLLLLAAEPTAEALALGRELAETGTLGIIMHIAEQQDTASLLDEAKSLSGDDREKLRATSARIFQSGRERLFSADARSWATHMNVEDLRALVAFTRSPAAQRQRAAMPAIVASTIAQVGQIDFKREIREAFCEETRKLCSGK